MSLPFHVNLKNQAAVVTGGGGILCSVMAKALAECGAKVAVLDLKPEFAQKVVDEINQTGGTARAFACNVLEKPSIEQAHEQIKKTFGPVDILINGAGGNHPKGTTSREFLAVEDLTQKKEGVATFYDLTVEGVQFVFNLNFPRHIPAHAGIHPGHGAQETRQRHQHFLDERVQAAHENPGLQRRQSRCQQFHPMARGPLLQGRRARQRSGPRLLPYGAEPHAVDAARRFVDARGNTIISHTPQGQFGKPEDLLGTLLWLLSDEASGFVTGQIIAVDGGFSAFSGV
jgi:NAD(P)-dependent dehydrogenase (short-subunit alcohol dehydrogenase family)